MEGKIIPRDKSKTLNRKLVKSILAKVCFRCCLERPFFTLALYHFNKLPLTCRLNRKHSQIRKCRSRKRFIVIKAFVLLIAGTSCKNENRIARRSSTALSQHRSVFIFSRLCEKLRKMKKTFTFKAFSKDIFIYIISQPGSYLPR